ncbi:MAG: SelB C-terminal domain-containing protein [Micropruina sp.]
MTIVATAGHVDHGKSALVRRLTGVEPDRLAEERRRGLTIELGHSWTTLPSGRTVSVIDVPGHGDFLGTTMRGLLQARAFLFAVSASEGWAAQSEQHLRALVAAGLTTGVVAVTKCDLADPAPVTAATSRRFADAGLAGVPLVAVSAATGAGLDALRLALDALPKPRPAAPVRLWIDRSFSVRGTGTVVTGTLLGGVVRAGDRLRCGSSDLVKVRRVQHSGQPVDELRGVARAALSLAGVSPEDVPRGGVLTQPDLTWTDRIDVHWIGAEERVREPLVTVGSSQLAGRLSRAADRWRLRLPRPLPLLAGDPLVLRDPGGRLVLGGLRVAPDVPARPQPAPPRDPAPPLAPWLARLDAEPLVPASRAELDGVSSGELLRLARAGRLIYLGDGMVLGAEAVRIAQVRLAELPERFRAGDALARLGLTRRVGIPFLEHLDRLGVTVRVNPHCRSLAEMPSRRTTGSGMPY